jgi:hypothetical protein
MGRQDTVSTYKHRRFDHHWVKAADFTQVKQILATVPEHTTRPWRNRWHPVSIELTRIVRLLTPEWNDRWFELKKQLNS